VAIEMYLNCAIIHLSYQHVFLVFVILLELLMCFVIVAFC